MTAPAYGNQPGSGGPLRYQGVSLPSVPNQKDDDLPSTWSKRAKEQQPALQYMRDCVAGPERIRECGTTYLPQDFGEPPQAYQARLNSSFFFNVTGDAVEGLTGLVFAKDLVLNDDVPPIIAEEHWENIDNAGTHGDVFAAELFQDALTAGHAGILVEFPKTDGKQTAADEKGAIRPYWVPIMKDNIVSWRTAVINGKTLLTQLVLKECTDAPVGTFAEKEETRYRRLFRDDAGVIRGELLQVNEDKSITVIGEPWVYPTQNEIPFAEIVTAGRRGLLESKPPLLDLAYKNVEHYQLTSDRKNSAHKTCVPIWVETGIDPDPDGVAQPVVLGTSKARRFTNPAARAGYSSHDGAALDSCTKIVEENKGDMAVLGLSMLAPDIRSAETAKGKMIDKAASDSKLGRSARGLQDGIERGLYFHARYLKLPSGGSATVNRDFDSVVMDAATMTAWGTLAEKLGIPVRVVLDALKKGGRLDKSEQDLDDLAAEIEANQAAIADQKAAELQMTLAAKQKQPVKAGVP